MKIFVPVQALLLLGTVHMTLATAVTAVEANAELETRSIETNGNERRTFIGGPAVGIGSSLNAGVALGVGVGAGGTVVGGGGGGRCHHGCGERRVPVVVYDDGPSYGYVASVAGAEARAGFGVVAGAGVGLGAGLAAGVGVGVGAGGGLDVYKRQNAQPRTLKMVMVTRSRD